MDLFNGNLSQQLKDEGMALSANNSRALLVVARIEARKLAMAGDGTCHADMVGRVLKEKYGIDSMGPAAGSLFKTSDWEWTGRWRRSFRVSNHGRMLRVWKLNA